jgi:hypothetical protein
LVLICSSVGDLPFLLKQSYRLLECCSDAWEVPMKRTRLTQAAIPAALKAAKAARLRWFAGAWVLVMFLASDIAAGQVITVDTRTGAVSNTSTAPAAAIDRRYQQIKPTHVPLPNTEMDTKTRLELIRVLQSEQGFAMRPFPRGHKGLTLVANGELQPAGEDYLAMVIAQGTSAKPGERLVLTDVKVDRNHIVFLLNGGPEGKHRFLRHIELGGGGGQTSPVIRDADQDPMGARLTLTFEKGVPALTGQDVKALLAPLISFDVKTPIEAFTDTLPDRLKEAVLNHQVLVGMSTEMLLFAKGQPETKSHEMDGNMPFDEWVYGKPPKDVEFVRINGNRVIRLEVAKMGKTPEVFTKDEVEGMMRTDGTPLAQAAEPKKAAIDLGDVERNPDTQAPALPPSLSGSGEKMPNANERGAMKPVQFPKQKPETPLPGANPDGEPESQPAADTKAPPGDGTQPSPGAPAPQQPASQPN